MTDATPFVALIAGEQLLRGGDVGASFAAVAFGSATVMSSGPFWPAPNPSAHEVVGLALGGARRGVARRW